MRRYGSDPLHPVRKQLRLNAEDLVRIQIDCGSKDELGGAKRPTLVFWCVACEEPFEWDASKGWFHCMGCDYELTMPEARNLFQVAVIALDEMCETLGVGGGKVGESEHSDPGMRTPGKGWLRWPAKLLERLRR